MQRGMRKCTWDVIYCILSVIRAWVLHGCLCTAQPQVTRRSLTDIYNSGRLWLSTRELGIHKCTMYGVFETATLDLGGKSIPDAPPINVTYTMDIWYRLKSNETHATIKGFGHFNPQPPSVRMRFMKTTNGLMYDFDTRVMLVDSQTGSEHSLNLLSPDREPPFHTFTVSMRSFDLHATVPLSPSYQIKVEHDNWQQLCHVSTYQMRQCHHMACPYELSRYIQDYPKAPWLPLPRPLPITEAGRLAAKTDAGTAFVVSQRFPYGLPAANLAPAYYSYAQYGPATCSYLNRYHNWLGFAAVIFYVRDDYLHELLSQQIIRKGIEERILIIVRWDGVPPFPLRDEQIYDQHLLTQHSSLAHWDEDTMVFHADLDEWMLIVDPEGGNLADLQLAGCLKNVSQALFQLFDTGAEKCGSDSEMDCFDPAGSLSEVHGLEHYTKHRPEMISWPKVMVHPDKTYGHHVHDSLDLPGYYFSKMDPQSCARVLHLVNLIKKRWGAESLYPNLTEEMPGSYFWALKNHAEFWQPEESLFSSEKLAP